LWIDNITAYLARAHLLQGTVSQAEAALQAVMARSQRLANVPERRMSWAWGELALAGDEPEMALSIADRLLASAPGAIRAQPIPWLLKLNGPGSEVAQMQTPIMRGKVYFMGAGPGDPDLLPAEAVSLLRAAEVVLHDETVSPEVLELVSASAQVRNVDRLIEGEAVLRDKVLSLLISAAHDGRQVVRLKSGDALSPECVAEELQALGQANVDCELILGTSTP